MARTVLLSMMLAQAAEPISGGAGWVGAGLLGAVLTWLLFIHLPAKDKLIRELVSDKDSAIKDLAEKYDKKLEAVTVAFQAESRESKKEFKDTLNSILVHCEKEINELVEAFRAEMNKVADEIKKVGGGRP